MRWLCTGGTRFATPHGSIAVEQILPGTALISIDSALLHAGPVGRIRLSAAELAARPTLWPVHITAGALANNLPATDITVLPDQPLPVPGLPPIAAKFLVDGIGLHRPPPQAALDVFSLSLATTAIPAALCLPDNTDHPPRPPDADLLAARRALAGIAPGPLVGSVDTVLANHLAGWADDGSDRPVALELTIDGITIPPALADQPRDDLAAAGIGDGQRGFAIVLDPPLDPNRRHLLRVRRALDGMELPGSPILLDAVPALAALLDSLPDETARRQAIEAAARAVAARL